MKGKLNQIRAPMSEKINGEQNKSNKGPYVRKKTKGGLFTSNKRSYVRKNFLTDMSSVIPQKRSPLPNLTDTGSVISLENPLFLG
jgi:hypothetical protein